MDIVKSQRSRVTILSLKGAVISDGLGPLNDMIETCLNAGIQKIILDLEKVPFIDSAGLEQILDIAGQMAKRGRDLRISSLNDVCRDIFTVTLMEKFVQICHDQDLAIKELA